MNKPVRWLGKFALLGTVAIAGNCFSAMPVVAQVSTVVNTATASFTDPSDPTAAPTTVTSNEVSLSGNLSDLAIELVKTGDRAAAEPGDTVIYRLTIRNTGSSALDSITVTDQLPLGMQFLPNSVQGALTAGTTTTPATVTTTGQVGQTVTFGFAGGLNPNEVLTIAYAVLLTPDAVRGTGRNLATATGRITTQVIQSNTASHQLQIRSGILADCGTLVGRVFEDKNFDGEQQDGEPGIPHAVIYMDDGVRVTTDAEGLFSLAYILAGRRTGTLDLTSVPGYELAPNTRRIQDNSQSRLVRIAPGGLERMNFAVTPISAEEQ